MADLLSDRDYAEIAAALGDAADTFFKTPVTVRIRGRIASAFNEGDNYDSDPRELLGLVVYATEGELSQAQRTAAGSTNLSEGYVLVTYGAAIAAGLVGPNNEIYITAHQDTVSFNNETYTIEGAPAVGPVKTGYALLKIHFKRKL